MVMSLYSYDFNVFNVSYTCCGTGIGMKSNLKPKDFRKTAMISPVYAKLNPKGLTRKQYRHLRKGIELLGKHNILHGDLPDNVMLNKTTGMPIIIDFDEARLDSKNTSMDYNAFLSHYKVSK